MTRRRLGRKLKVAQKNELLFHWRRKPSGLSASQRSDFCDGIVERRRKGLVTPLTYYRGRDLGQIITFMTNPVFVLIDHFRDSDGDKIDIASGDLLVRLKYFDGDETTDRAAMKAKHHVITVHSFEEQFNGLQILGNLEG